MCYHYLCVQAASWQLCNKIILYCIVLYTYVVAKIGVVWSTQPWENWSTKLSFPKKWPDVLKLSACAVAERFKSKSEVATLAKLDTLT